MSALFTGNRAFYRYGRREFSHSVEGEIDGVPFCHYFKSLTVALRVARKTGGTAYDLITLCGQRWDMARQRWISLGPKSDKETSHG